MGWAKIEFSGALAEGQAEWFRAIFLQVAWGLPEHAQDHLGLYRGRNDLEEPIYVLSPLAADAVARNMPTHQLVPCDRPAQGLFVVYGNPCAVDPSWFDLPADERECQLLDPSLLAADAGAEKTVLTADGWVDAPPDPGQGDLWHAA